MTYIADLSSILHEDSELSDFTVPHFLSERDRDPAARFSRARNARAKQLPSLIGFSHGSFSLAPLLFAVLSPGFRVKDLTSRSR
jgi:hypothetical protein